MRDLLFRNYTKKLVKESLNKRRHTHRSLVWPGLVGFQLGPYFRQVDYIPHSQHTKMDLLSAYYMRRVEVYKKLKRVPTKGATHINPYLVKLIKPIIVGH